MTTRKQKPEQRELSLSEQQVRKLKELNAMANRINQEMAAYVGAILDANGLEGQWTTGELKDKTLTVKKE